MINNSSSNKNNSSNARKKMTNESYAKIFIFATLNASIHI